MGKQKYNFGFTFQTLSAEGSSRIPDPLLISVQDGVSPALTYEPRLENLQTGTPTLKFDDFWWLDRVLDSDGNFLPHRATKNTVLRTRDEFDTSPELQRSLNGFYRIILGVLRGEDLKYLFTPKQAQNLGLTDSDLSGVEFYDAELLTSRIEAIYTYYCAAKGLPPNLLSEEIWGTLNSIMKKSSFTNIDSIFDDNPTNLARCYDSRVTGYYPGLSRCVTLNFLSSDSGVSPHFRTWVNTPMIISDTDFQGDSRYFFLDPSPKPKKVDFMSDVRVLLGVVSALIAVEEDVLRYKKVSPEPWVQLDMQMVDELMRKYWGHFFYFHLQTKYNRNKNNFGHSQYFLKQERLVAAIQRLSTFATFTNQNPGLFAQLQTGEYSNRQSGYAVSSGLKTRPEGVLLITI